MLDHGGKLRAAAQHYGIDLKQWLDLSTGINPQGWSVPAIPDSLWNRLPEERDGLLSAAAHYYGCSTLLAIAGSQASIQLLPSYLNSGQNPKDICVGIISPGYNEHAHAWQQAGYQVRSIAPEAIYKLDNKALQALSIVVVINPNNPTGDLFERSHLLKLHQQLAKQKGYLIIDEAFIDSTPEHSLVSVCPQKGLIVLRSLGKFFGLAGARVGFMFTEQDLLNRYQQQLGPWAVSNPARFVAAAALADFSWQERTRLTLKSKSDQLQKLLNRYGLTANSGTHLFQWIKHQQAPKIYQQLAQQGVLTRLFTAPISSLRLGLPARETDWQKLEQALAKLSLQSSLYPARPQQTIKQSTLADTLMVQGTTSDAGKSILVTGLCRVLKRLGYKVVPFKPQNMALNSCVAVDGGEIGRAQALQAQACGLDPHSYMNPVLLKPNTDIGAQVIIHGKAIGNMTAKQYQHFKSEAQQAVLTAHRYLQKNYSTIIVEGAGSPAEINLRQGDIANMGFAEAVDCSVILVADIDRGGVFAHLVGTLELLSPSEQARVKGFVINRFRGDLSLLKPGLDWLEEKTGKPVLGVLPYLKDLFLDAEDSPDKRQVSNSGSGVVFNIIVPILPHISNHNDFDPLRYHPQINLQFIEINQVPPACDLIILPGCKSVRHDLGKLITHGWQQHIQKHLRYGGKLLGICGGLQMLGQQVHDPLGLESEAGSSDGLQLLEIETTLQQEKQLQQVAGKFFPHSLGKSDCTTSAIAVSGYEIHAGKTTGEALQRPLIILDNDKQDGTYSADGNIIGSYLHGIFESASACNALLNWAGLKTSQTAIDYNTTRNQAIDQLADSIEEHLDMEKIIAIWQGQKA